MVSRRRLISRAGLRGGDMCKKNYTQVWSTGGLYAIVVSTMKKRQRSNTGRLVIIILLIVLALYGFFIGPLRALTNEFLLAGILNLFVAMVIMMVFFYLTLWLAGAHV